MLAPLIRTLPFLLLFLACGQNAEAAISTAYQKTEINSAFPKSEINAHAIFSKNKKKRRWGQRIRKFVAQKLPKWIKKNGNERKFGLLGVGIFLGSLILGLVSSIPLFLPGALVMLIFSILGLSNDEKKTWSYIGLVLTGLIVVGLVLIIAQYAAN